jgi:dimethylargininase
VAKAVAQHKAYQECLTQLGLRIVSLAAESALPDAVFVEDTAIVLDELAVVSIMGAPSRRREAESVADVLARYRSIKFLTETATLDGGDVLQIGRSLFVGLSQRTNREALTQLQEILAPYGYRIVPVEVTGCLHLKSACSYIGRETVLINRALIDEQPFGSFKLLDVPVEEPAAANALLISNTVILPASFPKTRILLEERGFQVQPIDLSELQKAEAGVTCTSLIFKETRC